MTPGASAIAGFAVAGGFSFVLTPVAIAVAQRTGFLDHPRGYRKHTAPTPFLGGAAVLLGFLIAVALVGTLSDKLVIVLLGAGAMWLLGTLDDRFAVPPKFRILAAAIAAVTLDRAGLGWQTAGGAAVDLALTVLWIVGLVNAFNLMDNLDGACSSVAGIAAAGIGVLAAIKGEAATEILAFSLSGACTGFLPWNLAGPAKIFLGDGGSMPIGFLVAALAMATSRHSQAGSAGVLVGALLVGLPILDVTLVSISRTRRNVSLLTGGRDHLSHRILRALRTPRAVAGALGLAQGTLCACAIAGYALGGTAVMGFAFAAFSAGVVAIIWLDSASWRPTGIAVGEQRRVRRTQTKATTSVGVDPG